MYEKKLTELREAASETFSRALKQIQWCDDVRKWLAESRVKDVPPPGLRARHLSFYHQIRKHAQVSAAEYGRKIPTAVPPPQPMR